MSETEEILTFIAICLLIYGGLFAYLYIIISVFKDYFEPFCRLYMSMYAEEQYKHYMAALEQTEVPVFTYSKICKSGFEEPKDAYYVIVFDDGDIPLFLNGKIVIQSRFRPAVDRLRKECGKEF